MNIRFQVDTDRLTLNDLVALEDENQSPRFMRDFLARFVVDDKGEYLEDDEAQQAVGNLTLSELMETVEQFGEAVEGLQDKIVPKVNASP